VKTMANDLIIDAHVHTYPTAEIGRQATQGFSQSGASGTVPELLAAMARGKISYAVMANMTPTYEMKMAALENIPAGSPNKEKEKAEQEIDEKVIARMKRRNLWSCTMSKENPPLVPLISIDLLQSPADMQAEIEEKMGQGAKGLKLHPVNNRFSPHDRRMWPAYSKAMEKGLPILFHSGEAELAGHPGADNGRPRNFEPLLQSFPKLTVILAHMAKGFLEESAALAQKFGNVYFDISAIISLIGIKGGFSSDAHAGELIRKIGVERVLFGSDWPWFDPLLAMERFNGLDLTQEEKRKILGINAAKIFGLESLNQG